MREFQCYQCGKYFSSMWGSDCNGCRSQNEQHEKLVSAISASAMTEAKLKTHEEMAILTKNLNEKYEKALEKIANDRSPPWDKMDYQAVAREALKE